MTQSGPPSAQADVNIGAAADAVYALITDLPTLTALAEETTAMSWHKGDSVRPGAVFKGNNRNGSKSWTTTCTVTEAVPGRVFAFDVRSAVIPVAHWRYEIDRTEDGCHVTETTWDRRPGWFRKLAGKATGVHDRDTQNAKNIAATLQRLKQHAERG
ncbi:SRPBCC family protein [soil metagenome]